MVVKMILEPRLERVFHPSSYAYRPKRSARQVVAQARRNCWNYAWVIDLDIRAFFDTIDHELIMCAVEKHVPEKWIRLYIQRWLESEVELADGTIETRNCGTPQGGVISPLLANCQVSDDSISKKSYPLFIARDMLCDILAGEY